MRKRFPEIRSFQPLLGNSLKLQMTIGNNRWAIDRLSTPLREFSKASCLRVLSKREKIIELSTPLREFSKASGEHDGEKTKRKKRDFQPLLGNSLKLPTTRNRRRFNAYGLSTPLREFSKASIQSPPLPQTSVPSFNPS